VWLDKTIPAHLALVEPKKRWFRVGRGQ